MVEEERVTYERNKTVVKMFWVSLTFAVIVSILNKNPRDVTLIRVIASGICGAAVTFLSYRHIAEKYVKYIIIAGLSVIVYLMFISSPHFGNYVLIYFSLTLATMYHDFIAIIVSRNTKQAIKNGDRMVTG